MYRKFEGDDKKMSAILAKIASWFGGSPAPQTPLKGTSPTSTPPPSTPPTTLPAPTGAQAEAPSQKTTTTSPLPRHINIIWFGEEGRAERLASPSQTSPQTAADLQNAKLLVSMPNITKTGAVQT
jgi:hypothetical protein